jgi:hypothetical protein
MRINGYSSLRMSVSEKGKQYFRKFLDGKKIIHPKQYRQRKVKIEEKEKMTEKYHQKNIERKESRVVEPTKSRESPKIANLDNFSKLHGAERIHKVIARTGIASRRDAERMVSSLQRIGLITPDTFFLRYWMGVYFLMI